jgi:tripartite-type tricarboxylate transporter receptor subunit TctC
MLIPRFVAALVSVCVMMLSTGVAYGQDPSTELRTGFPSKPIRIITPGAGSSADIASRLIAQGISGPLAQQVIVDNRPNGVIAADAVAKAPPDGYTLLLAGGSFTIGPLLQNTPFDPVRDFAPITLAVRAPNVLVVHPSLPIKSVKELIALAKARPGELNYASAGSGSSSQLAGELFKSMAGVNIAGVPYKSGTTLMIAVIGGEVQLMFGTGGSVAAHIKSGKLRALAVTSPQPSALTPGLPTVAATVPGYEADTTYGIFAPAKTPQAIVNRLNQEIVRLLKSAEAKERLFNSGLEVIASSPEQHAVAMKSEIARLGKVIKDAGIHAE